jgi:microcystin-dependent protein
VSEPFISEVRIMSFGFAPRGWALCNGQVLSIQQNLALFSLLGTYYGGNGSTTFALPDLRGRIPICFDPGTPLGQRGGAEAHTLISSELGQHSHTFQASTTNGDINNPTGGVLARFNNMYYAPPDSLTPVGQAAPYGPMIGPSGQSGPHENRMPYLTLNFCIALQGAFPSRN